MLTAQIVGNIGGDPELKYSANGNPFLRFNVASNDRKRTSEGEYEDTVEWVRVTVFRQRAETLANYLHKGMKVFVSGRLTSNPWVTDSDEIRAGLEIMGDYVEFMSPRQDGDDQPQQRRSGNGNSGGGNRQQGGNSGGGYQRGSSNSGGNRQQRPQQQNRPQQPKRSQQNDDEDDDLPF